MLSFACSQRNDQDVSTIENEKMVRLYYTYFNEHQWDKMAELYANQSEFKDPSLGTSTYTLTRTQITKKYADLNAMFPNIHDSIVQIYTSGNNQIIVEFISTGSSNDSTSFYLPICTIFGIQDGKITKDYTYYDN